MGVITLHTYINAPVERCFDLSRSIELHLLSTTKTKERVVAGRRTGLIEKGETVTWEANHFGIRQRLEVQIQEMRPYIFFSDEMVKGAFKSMYHEHHFEADTNGTMMQDKFEYSVPLGGLESCLNCLS